VRAIGLISRFKQLAMEPTEASQRVFDATALLELTLRTLLPQLQKRHIQLVFDAEPGITLAGETERFEQIVENLVDNALLHGFEGRDQGQLSISFQRRDGSTAVLSVSDDGIGMDSQLLDRIFEPYFTTKFGQGGSGLGLYIVHNIVIHVFHGRIHVSSAYGKGTTFTIELPVAPAAHRGAAP
jgi:signal transduction histidine kinase